MPSLGCPVVRPVVALAALITLLYPRYPPISSRKPFNPFDRTTATWGVVCVEEGGGGFRK